ncbi:hypothetical protein M427DRAFT_178025 [Gonapodya prolifera JEL478]|uniref:Myb-like domain-containing protein n=1 Tax=Gonapodya prolifera (strain JEL478) TaxID=1344416 RepID=A0A139AQ47_GONPJ|nr:hypothetical protein M427DRAFT_178025 [Gonapodya prolifera JEL478]|eukprot:KXS18869.1 hypothetical protein M427DRAFT_178025 [Gonapodya prolifera JEL478]
MGNKVLGFHALREKAMASSSSSAPNRATGSSSIMPRPSAGSIIDIDTPQKEFPVRGPVQYLDPVPPLPRAPPAQIIVKKKQPRQKKMWTQVEVDALERGLAKYGCGWREILYDIELGDILVNRSNVQLKDKARSEKERRIRNREALGVWEVASMLVFRLVV